MKNFIRVFSIFVAIASLMALTMCKRLPKTPKQTGIGKGNDTLVANINDTLPIKVDSLGGLQITAFAATFDHALLSSPNGKAQLQIPTVNACTESRLAKRELALSLDMGEDFELGADAAIKSKVLLKVELQDANNALLNTPKWNVELQTDQGRPEEQLRIDFDNIPSNATKVLVSIQPQGYTPPADPKAQAKIRLRAWVIQDLRISTNKTGQAPQKWLVPKEINLTRYPPIFAWTSRCPTLPNYELQLLRLHNRLPANVGMPFGTNPRVISTSIDWSEALSIETSSPRTTFQLFPAEGTGYYIYRVRPIGNYHEGGIANPLNWGMWCGEAPTGNSVVVTPALDLQYANIFFFEDPADGKNRQYNRRFHEGDQSRTAVLEQMTIADGNSRVLQTQTRLESTSDVLVKQHVYDHLGRESFVSMGAPARNPRGMDYLPGVFTHDAGGNKAYSAQNFDTQAKRANPDKVTGIVSNYYDNHPSVGISATEGYPFSLTSYFNEPQQRPFEKSGPGSAMRPGSGKGINYSFAPAKEAELVRVFGDEAPIASRVYTVTTSSPDGVSHVAYYEGEQLIATCLMDGGASPFAAINERGMDPFTQSDTLRGNNNAARIGH